MLQDFPGVLQSSAVTHSLASKEHGKGKHRSALVWGQRCILQFAAGRTRLHPAGPLQLPAAGRCFDGDGFSSSRSLLWQRSCIASVSGAPTVWLNPALSFAGEALQPLPRTSVSKVSLRGVGEGLVAAQAHPVSPSPRQQSRALAAPSSAHRGASAGPSATGDSSKETLPQAVEQGRWQPAFPGCLRPLFLMRNKAPSWGHRVSALQVSALKAAFPEQCTALLEQPLPRAQRLRLVSFCSPSPCCCSWGAEEGKSCAVSLLLHPPAP